MTAAALLPPNATPLERALEAAMAVRPALDASRIAAVWNPDDCPVPLLPFLAWGLSVDVWDPAWPERMQREACRQAIRLHQLKTTPAGIRAHVALTGASVERIVRPPTHLFLRDTQTPDELRAWRDRLPQVRIYPFANRVPAGAGTFLSGGAITRFIGGFLIESRGPQLRGRRASFVENGVETPVLLAQLGDGVERIVLGDNRRRLWLGRAFLGRTFLTDTTADTRILTLRAKADAQAFPVRRSLEPIDVAPDRVSIRRDVPRSRRMLGRFGGYLIESDGPMLIYDRIALHDDALALPRRRALAWAGASRLGMAPFSAELQIKVPMQRARRRAGRWAGVGFLMESDMKPLRLALEAVGSAKAARDTILVNPSQFAPPTFGAGLRFGNFTFGQLRKAH